MDDHTVTGRVLAVLGAVGSRAEVRLRDLTLLTGIPQSTVRRIADDLARRGALVHDGAVYRIGPLIATLGGFRPAVRVEDAAQDALRSLHDRLGGAAWFAAADRLTAQPAQVACDAVMRPLVANAWPEPRAAVSYAATALGHAVLSRRPDLMARLRTAPRGALLAGQVGLGAERGFFVVRGVSPVDQRDWLCVAVPAGAAGVVGVTLPAANARETDAVRTVRAAAARVTAAADR